MNDMNSPMPSQRFSFLIAKALELCNELRSAGEQFLQAKEKRDAEALSLLKAEGCEKGDLTFARWKVPALGTKEWDKTTMGRATVLARAPVESELGGSSGERWRLVVENEGGRFHGVGNVIVVFRYALKG
jgi:hypothetical protein